MLKLGGIYNQQNKYFIIFDITNAYAYCYNVFDSIGMTASISNHKIKETFDNNYCLGICESDFWIGNSLSVEQMADGYLGQMEERHVDLLQHVFHLMKGN